MINTTLQVNNKRDLPQKYIDKAIDTLKNNQQPQVNAIYLFPKYGKNFNKLPNKNKAVLLALHTITTNQEVQNKTNVFVLLSAVIFNQLSKTPSLFENLDIGNIFNTNNINSQDYDFLTKHASPQELNQYQKNFNNKLQDLHNINFMQFAPRNILAMSLMPSVSNQEVFLAFDHKGKNIYQRFKDRRDALEFVKFDLNRLLKPLEAPSPSMAL